MTVGIQNHNPLNIKNDPADPWKGSSGADAQGHAIFDDPIYSIRGCARILARKWAAGKRTIYEIIESYAPDGVPGRYAGFVATRMGLLPYHIHDSNILHLFHDNGKPWDVGQLVAMIQAMAEFENFSGYKLPPNLIENGIAFYEHDFT